MISFQAVFWLMVGFFALIGSLRGWTKEVIATAGLILSLFALEAFAPILLGFIGGVPQLDPLANPPEVGQQQYRVLTIVHLVIAFFSYQGPTLAGARIAERLRVRESFQDKVMGGLVGAVNGYLIVGTLWAYLIILDYPFTEDVMVPPTPTPTLLALTERLPIPFLSPYLALLLVLVFLFVIIVMI